MSKLSHKMVLLARRRKRVRKKIAGTAETPRLSVRRSIKHIYAQIVDDTSGLTLVEASSMSLKIEGANIEAAKKVGAALGERAKEKSIGSVCFDRGGRLYHGRVKALAESARKAGLKF